MISKNTLQLLEFDRLLEIISAGSHSEISRRAVLDIAPLFSGDAVRHRSLLISDIRRAIQLGSAIRFHAFQDISPLMNRVRPQGAVLDAAEISAFIPVLSMARDIAATVAEIDGLQALPAFVNGLTGQPDLLKRIRLSISPEGMVMDSASSALADIRRELRRLESGIQKKLEEMTRAAPVSVFLQDDFITKRAGRWVIPVRMDSKGMIPGVVHDVSKSGETAFIEPLAIIHLSNELENLSAEEKAEELRILRAISASIREKADDIAREFDIIVYLDTLNCIAGFADQLRMEVPEITETPMIRLVKARHPLLEVSFANMGWDERVVPLDLQLGGDATVMVITGSNAGGKTIAIKTVGLLLCMALSGMPVAAASSSHFPLVSSLLVDMGDEQSIESNLSTFSAHVRNIAEILETADAASVVLIDELGTGTDPDEGAALACAVLKELQKKGALVCATTHLMGIKGYVHTTTGMTNASMEFDNKTLTPLYQLREGEPGQSHALEIAGKYGLPGHVIATARQMLGDRTVELDSLMAELKTKRDGYERLVAGMAAREEELKRKEGILEQRMSAAERQQRNLLADAHREALALVSDIKRQMSVALEEMKKKDRRELRERMRAVEQKQKAVAEQLAAYETDDGMISIDDIRIGDTVFLKSFKHDGTVAGIMEKGKRVKVVSGSKEILVPVSEIRVAKGKRLPAKAEEADRLPSADEMVPASITLIGLRVDEALSRLEPFLNHAALAGFHEITVIHGVGTGILQRTVRQHLEGHPLVKQFRSGEQSEGGAGVTVVMLK